MSTTIKHLLFLNDIVNYETKEQFMSTTIKHLLFLNDIVNYETKEYSCLLLSSIYCFSMIQ